MSSDVQGYQFWIYCSGMHGSQKLALKASFFLVLVVLKVSCHFQIYLSDTRIRVNSLMLHLVKSEFSRLECCLQLMYFLFLHQESMARLRLIFIITCYGFIFLYFKSCFEDYTSSLVGFLTCITTTIQGKNPIFGDKGFCVWQTAILEKYNNKKQKQLFQ